jgi:hypothetical protein
MSALQLASVSVGAESEWVWESVEAEWKSPLVSLSLSASVSV